MLTQSELRGLWEKTGFMPKKRLGQNFLVDKNVKEKILRNLELNPGDTVIEIGPGFGELTFDLAKLSKEVFSVEKDRKIVGILKDEFELPKNVCLLEKDFLDVDIRELAERKKAVVYGNLPYYATSPIIEKLFKNIQLIKRIYLVVQKEVADRILARPGSKDIGRLSLFVQYYTEPKRIFKIGKGSFYPAPKVESTFLAFDVLRKQRVSVKNEDLLFEIIKKAYNQRRKTILNSLSGLAVTKETLACLLKTAKLNPKARAEDLSLEDFARLSNLLRK